jgi:uncharacterized coiled-coil protein SlyX
MRPNFDSIALPLARFIRDEAERRARAVEARQALELVALSDFIVDVNLRLAQTEIQLDETRERLGSLETEVRSTVRST